ncbi:hypothetical protein [uncultured Leifsonia sp.]|uniref:hypothetical protein n=1 Tax=Leifsonia sp. TaxID=1870902 RepID=UPI0028D448E0|nr:hypothetical protein [uncultured Leifsonia sp.]
MLTTRSGRLVPLLAAAALVGAGLLAATPAHAEDPQAPAGDVAFGASPTTFGLGAWTEDGYAPGSWDSGLTLSGAGFGPDAMVTVTLVGTDEGDPVLTDSTEIAADADGAFDETWTPAEPPLAGLAYSISATDGDSTSDPVALDVLAPEGIVASPATISTRELHDSGVTVAAGGFAPGEPVSIAVEYGPAAEDHETTANLNGAVGFGMTWYGSLRAGTITFTLTGAESGHVETASVTVTGETIHVGPGDESTPPRGGIAPTTALPKVSG